MGIPGRSTRRERSRCLWIPLAIILAMANQAAALAWDDAFLEFVRARADALRDGDRPPGDLQAWADRRVKIREGLTEAWGEFPADPCPLAPRNLGTIERDGYRVEKLVFQTRPGVLMTANAYVPAGDGPRPAILCVHGHWRGAKQDPVVQSRCIGAAKLGFFVLAVDAFGAGERGIGKALGEYHGGATGATLLPIGMPLSGLQVYENMRAVDYLKTRPEVDGSRIGITGASGGGNQSMYAGGFDERFGAVAPVCSVGNYRSYLGAACCMCEVVPGALRFTEEWGVLGLAAPRGLLFINATRDAVQFSVSEAKKSLAALDPLYRVHGKPGHVRQTVFESGHDYSRAMREAVHGWMALHLKGEGDGSPIPEPEVKPEEPESLRCFPGDSRPDDYVTIPRFAHAEGKKLVAAVRAPRDADDWRRSVAPGRMVNLVERVLGGFPRVAPVDPEVERDPTTSEVRLSFVSEPGITLSARVEPGKDAREPRVLVLNLEGAETASKGANAAEARRLGHSVVTLDLRATGKLARASDRVGALPDHNTGEWALWIGRPLIAQWVQDVRRLLDALEKVESATDRSPVVLIGEGPAGLVALAAAAVDPRVTKVAAVGSLASYLTETPYEGQRLGVLAPGILRHVGDVAHLASLAAPRRVVIAGGVAGDGSTLAADRLRESYQPAVEVWTMIGAPEALTILPTAEADALARALR